MKKKKRKERKNFDVKKKKKKNLTSSIKTTLHSQNYWQSAHFCKQINAKRLRKEKKNSRVRSQSQKTFLFNKRNCPFMPVSKGWG